MNNKVKFINKMFDTLHCRLAILEFLKEEKLITGDVIETMSHQHHSAHAINMVRILSQLEADDKLQLVSYEWVILPFEKMKLILISNSNRKEFEYNT